MKATVRIIGSAFLIAGTCIGAGMLALPVIMAPAGFYFSLLLLIFCWALMFYTGLLVAEANICLPRGANFISMSSATLGKAGEIITWIIYLLLLYSLMAAYLSAAGDLLRGALHNFNLVGWIAPIPLIFLVAFFIYFGARFVDYFGRFLLIGLIVSYALLVAIATPHLTIIRFATGHFYHLFFALAIVVAAFGYHVTIPSLRIYLQDDLHKLRWAILLGSLIPLLAYILWIAIIFGLIPIRGAHGLLLILRSGDTVSRLLASLSTIANNNIMIIGAKLFITFAITSSFLGISFGLFDFLADGFQIKKTASGKSLLALLAFLPPYIFVILYPKGFLIALSYAGIFVAILHGILPVLMVWAGKYKGLISKGRALTNVIGLVVVLLFSLLVIASQIAK